MLKNVHTPQVIDTVHFYDEWIIFQLLWGIAKMYSIFICKFKLILDFLTYSTELSHLDTKWISINWKCAHVLISLEETCYPIKINKIKFSWIQLEIHVICRFIHDLWIKWVSNVISFSSKGKAVNNCNNQLSFLVKLFLPTDFFLMLQQIISRQTDKRTYLLTENSILFKYFCEFKYTCKILSMITNVLFE